MLHDLAIASYTFRSHTWQQGPLLCARIAGLADRSDRAAGRPGLSASFQEPML